MMGIVSKASVTPVMQGRWLCQGNFQWTETLEIWLPKVKVTVRPTELPRVRQT